MSGLCFVIGAERTRGERVLGQMVQRMQHRNAGGCLLLEFEELHLGVVGTAKHPRTMLATSPDLVVALVGTLDVSVGRSWQTPSATDAARVLAGVQTLGDAALAELTGEFVALVWFRHEKRLLIARDLLGIRPLFLWRQGAETRGASDPFVVLMDQPAVPDPGELAVALVEEPGRIFGSRYLGVTNLLPGTQLEILPDGAQRSRRLRSLLPVASLEVSFAEASNLLEERLRQAVAQCLTEPCCIMVSGGVDSTTLAALAVDEAKRAGLAPPLLATVRYPGLPCDESLETQRLADHLRLPLHAMDAPNTPGPYAPRTCVDLFWDPSQFLVETIASHAKANGARVLLTGIGADEVFPTTGFEAEDALLEVRLADAAAFCGLQAEPWAVMGWRRLLHAAKRSIEPGPLPRGERQNLPDFATDTGRAAIHEMRALRRADLQAWDAPLPGQRFVVRELVHGPQAHALFHQFDLSGAIAGVDLRYPYLNECVVRTVLGMPMSVRARPGLNKALLRSVAARVLPPSLAYRRRKVPFDAFFDRAALSQGHVIAELFGNSRLERRGLVAPGTLLRLLKEVQAGERGGDRELQAMFGLELWLAALDAAAETSD